MQVRSAYVLMLALAVLAGCGGTPAGRPAAQKAGRNSQPASSASGSTATASQPAHSAGTPATPAHLTHLTLGVASANLGQVPLWVAIDDHLFQHYGLDVTLETIQGGTQTMAAMASGKLPLATTAGPTVIKPILKGIPIRLIAGQVDVMMYDFLVAPGIASAAQLKGAKGGISGFGSADYFVQLYALKKLGVNPNSVHFLRIGNETNRLAALRTKQIQFTVLSAGLDTPALAAGFKPLLKMYETGQPYQATAVAVYTPWAKTHHQEILDFLKGLVAANAFVLNPKNEAAALGIASKRLHIPVAKLKSAFELYRSKAYRLYPLVSKAGMDFVLQNEKTGKPASYFYDNSYVHQLQQAKFAASLGS